MNISRVLKYSILLICVLLCFASCGETKPNDDPPRTDGFILNPEPPDTGVPVDSSGITAGLVEAVTTASDKIHVVVVGSNVENNFLYCFCVPALEKKVDGEWVSMPMTDESSVHLSGDPDYFWMYSNSDDGGVMWTTVTLETNTLCDKITVGEYRICIFFPDKNLYVEFEVEE